jgi:hypothetical protein
MRGGGELAWARTGFIALFGTFGVVVMLGNNPADALL